MRDRLIMMCVAIAVAMAGCLDDPNAVVFGPGDLDAGADVGGDGGVGDTGDEDSGEVDAAEPDVEEPDVEEPDAGADADDPDACVPGDEGCVPAHCGNGQHDGDESDVDCGGSCQGCDAGALCERVEDCSDAPLVVLDRCDWTGVSVCASLGVGVYQVGELACEPEGEGEDVTRCVASFRGQEEVEDDPGCARDTEGESCGEARVEVGECMPLAGELCSVAGTRMVTTYLPLCSAERCEEVPSVLEQSCTLDVDLEEVVCRTGSWSEWGPCMPEVDSCSSRGVQERTRSVARCLSNGTCSTTSAEEESDERGCSQTPDPQLCSSTGADDSSYVCFEGECCMPDCSGADLSCRGKDDGCGGICEARECDIGQGCGVDGQCRLLCAVLVSTQSCSASTDCEGMCACASGAAPTCATNPTGGRGTCVCPILE